MAEIFADGRDAAIPDGDIADGIGAGSGVDYPSPRDHDIKGFLAHRVELPLKK
jgi:hypothetical protein